MEKLSKGKIVLIALMFVLSIGFFVFKDQIAKLNPANQTSQNIISSYVKTTAIIISMEVQKGRRHASNNIYHIQFRDQKGNLQNTSLQYNSIITLKDSMVIYYDPQAPTKVISEKNYNEIM